MFIRDEEILDCDTDDEAISLIQDCVQDDFEQRISWYFKTDVVAWVKDMRAK